MSIDHFNHVTLNTAHSAKSHRADVPPEAMIVMRKWLSEAIQSDDAYPLPVPALSHFSCQVSVLGSGGLIATVFAPAAPHTPWLAVAAHPSTPAMTGNYQDTMSWLADFERCVAWAWISQQDHD